MEWIKINIRSFAVGGRFMPVFSPIVAGVRQREGKSSDGEGRAKRAKWYLRKEEAPTGPACQP
jgi:hypothetical protein